MTEQPKFVPIADMTPLDIPYEEIQAPTFTGPRVVVGKVTNELEIRGPRGDEHEKLDAIVLNGVRFVPE